MDAERALLEAQITVAAALAQQPAGQAVMWGEDDQAEVWVTRSEAGYTIEPRPKPGTPTANAATLQQRSQAALAANTKFLAIAAPSIAQNTAQIKALTRQIDALIRLLLGQLDSITDS